MRESILFDIKELHHLIGKSMFIDLDINPKYKPGATQIRFIDYLVNHKDSVVTGKDLENYFHISKATVSDVLNTMEKHMIITRVVSDVDTRTKKIILNDEYKIMHKKFNKEISKMSDIVTNEINDDELRLFYETLNKMKDNVYKYLNEVEERNDVNDKNV